MVGGTVIETQRMTISWGCYPNNHQAEVIRLWCVGSGCEAYDETCVYAEPYADGEGPKVGDQVWWQAGWIYFDNDKKRVRKVGYSFKPEGAET